MKAILRSVFLALALLALTVSAHAGPYEDGSDAYQRRDYATALKFLQPLAEQGHARAQYNLGLMYTDGKGVPRDSAVAVKWYRKAANQGYTPSQIHLAWIYEGGWDVPRDYAEAAKWFRMAAEGGHFGAQHSLSVMYYQGQGVPQDYAEAAKWYLKFYLNAWDEDDTVVLIVLGGPIVVAVIVFLARHRIAGWWRSRRKGFRIWIFGSASWAMGMVVYVWILDSPFGEFWYWDDEKFQAFLRMATVPPLFFGLVWFGYTKLLR